MEQVTNIGVYRGKKLSEQRANDFATNVIKLIDPVKYENTVLKTLLDVAEKVCYFSGDIDEKESRNVEVCDKYSPLCPAESQQYVIQKLGNIVRLIFDGEYIYDVYLSNSLDEKYITEFIRLLDVEGYFNFMKAEVSQKKFDQIMSQPVNHK